MRVLVCDDEPAARYVARRWLTTLLGCDVTECADGVQALEVLATRSFDAAILDLDMPGLTGIEVVETLRSTDAFRDMPIIILSQERRASVIRELIDLGVAAYLLKPLREQSVLGRLGPILERIRTRRAQAGPGRTRPSLRAGEPTMLVDGDANFAHVFAAVASPFAAVMTVDSGAAAMARFRQTPVPIVFVGRDLGLVPVPTLLRKVRDIRQDVFVIGVGYAGVEAALFDAVMPRSYMPAVLSAEVAKFATMEGPLEQLESLAPGFRGCLRSAVHQVLGMMANLEVSDSGHGPAPGAEAFVSTVTVSVGGKQTLDLDFLIPCAVAEAATMRMLECPASGVDAEGCESTASELANVMSGRLNTWMKEHGLACSCRLPQTRRCLIDDPLPISAHEFMDHFGVPEISASISVRGRIPDACVR